MLPRNVLIFHAGALGDFVLGWPLGLALARIFPQSRIIFITQKQKGELAEKVLRLESADVESGWHHLFGDAGGLPANCRKMLEGSHSVFTFIAKAGDQWSDSVAGISPKAKIVPVSVLPDGGANRHATEFLADSLSQLPIVQTALRQILSSISTNGVRSLPEPASGPIAVHPGSGGREKCWPLESYLKLIELLQKRKIACRAILGEVELERWPTEAIRRLKSATEVVQPASYLELFNELSAARAFVGNDSGPGHLAGIIGRPTLILFGPTDPAVWKPLGPRVRTIHQPLEKLTAEDVAKTAMDILPR